MNGLAALCINLFLDPDNLSLLFLVFVFPRPCAKKANTCYGVVR
jgi:hypothetical protein